MIDGQGQGASRVDTSDAWHVRPEPVEGYVPYLDGIRALAVLVVMLSHFRIPVVSEFVPGGFGVTVFFFLSGFLITRLLLFERSRFCSTDLGGFYLRRSLRLVPPLVLMLVASCLFVVFVEKKSVPPGDVMASLFYYMNYYLILTYRLGENLAFEGWIVLWSLAVEEHFYILFPLVIAFFSRRAITGVVALIVLSMSVRVVDWILLDDAGRYVYYATETRIESILWGCLLSLTLAADAGREFVLRHLFRPCLFYVALCLIMLVFLIRPEVFQGTLKFSVQGLLLFIAFVQVVFTTYHEWAKRFLEHPLLRVTGKISYSLYLWHVLCLHVAYSLGLADGTAALMAFVLSFLVALVSYRLVEEPLGRVRRNIGRNPVRLPT